MEDLSDLEEEPTLSPSGNTLEVEYNEHGAMKRLILDSRWGTFRAAQWSNDLTALS